MATIQPNDSGASSRLLVVDDDRILCSLIKEYLEGVGYEVSLAHSGVDGLERALREPFHAVILDLMLPGIDGFEFLRRLRARTNLPVLMLTGRGEEPDRIVGLEMGADDYLPKTFSTRELLARLRAVLRRSMMQSGEQASRNEGPIIIGKLFIDTAARSALYGGEDLALTRAEFQVLVSLAASCGRVKTREQLLLEAADRDFEVFDRSIDVHISSLRKKLGDDAKAPRYIQTVRGVGYIMRWPEEA